MGADDNSRAVELEATLDASTSSPTLAAAPVQRLGRYILLELVGEGAMGVVYKAYDPELDRNIAIKLMRAERSSEEARARLLREAQAMARLSHPNVVAVHDAGVRGEQVFLAMELVNGVTLSAWLREQKRDTQSILDVFVQAARGLAAAHDAGLLHRDFKPDNVLVDREGIAKVTDFGLALLEHQGERVSPSPAVPVRAQSPQLTQIGALLGTPAYMSPEQLAGSAVGQRSDQFSFAVALHEALQGERPFLGETVDELRGAIRAANRPPLRVTAAPRHVRAALSRALAVDPEARFDSMKELISVLSRTRQRVFVAVGIAVAAVAIASTVVLARAERSDVDPCADADRAVSSVWGEPQRGALQRALGAASVPGSERATNTMLRHLDDYAVALRRASVQVCRDTRVLRTHDAQALAIRSACLDRRRAALAGVVSVLSEVEPGAAANGVRAVLALAPVSDCLDADAVRATGSLAEARSPTENDRALAAYDKRARAIGLLYLGSFEEAHELLEATLVDTREAGLLAGEAETLELLGTAELALGHSAVAERRWREAVVVAERANATAARAAVWSKLVALLGHETVRFDEAHQAAAVADAIMENLEQHGVNTCELRLRLSANEAGVYMIENELGAARRVLERGLAACHGGQDGYNEGRVLRQLAAILWNDARPQEGLEVIDRSVATFENAIGASAPDVAPPLTTRAKLLADLLRHDEAEASAERALAISSDETLASTLAYVLRWRDPPRAIDAARSAIAAAGNSEHPLAAFSRFLLGQALLANGDPKAAEVECRAALEVVERFVGENSSDAADVRGCVADPLAAQRRFARAAALHEQSLKARESVFGDSHPLLIQHLAGLGLARLSSGDVDAAIPVLERAVALEGRPVDRWYQGRARFGLAEARWAAGDREAALEYAAKAQADLETRPADPEAKRLTEWRAAHTLDDSAEP